MLIAKEKRMDDQEREESGKMILLAVIICLLTVLGGMAISACANALGLKPLLRILLLAVGVIAVSKWVSMVILTVLSKRKKRDQRS